MARRAVDRSKMRVEMHTGMNGMEAFRGLRRWSDRRIGRVRTSEDIHELASPRVMRHGSRASRTPVGGKGEKR